MLNFIRFLFVRIDQESILKWCGLLDLNNTANIYDEPIVGTNDDFSSLVSEPSTDVSAETLRLIIEGIWNKLQSGLTLTEIENVLFFILFVRFVLLAVRYNIKTSFYITCITVVTSYLWYRHFIDLVLLYRQILLKIPLFHKLGLDALDLRTISRQTVRNNATLGENVHWYNVGKLAYYTFTKGIVDVDPVSGLKSYIDPISMVVSNLDEPLKSKVVPYYYKIYNGIIPRIFGIWSRFWAELSGLVAYVLIVRVGKKYCPYAIRWHWTLLLILGFFEQIFRYLINRMLYFESEVLFPKLMAQIDNYQFVDPELLLEINVLTVIISSIAVIHMSIVFLCLLHAACGQYFYLPFVVDNTELHVGLREKNSVYSGGYTSWQDEEEKKRNLESQIPNFWYGWFGKRSNSNWKPIQFIFNYLERVVRLWIQRFRRK